VLSSDDGSWLFHTRVDGMRRGCIDVSLNFEGIELEILEESFEKKLAQQGSETEQIKMST